MTRTALRQWPSGPAAQRPRPSQLLSHSATRAPLGSSDRLIVALDFTDLASALAMARHLRGLVRTVKVGSVLFTACGPKAIERMRALGFEVMLDLKFHDIPSTVELSCRAAVAHRVSFLTVHAIGQKDMLQAALNGVQEESSRMRVPCPLVLAVTVLTSVGLKPGISTLPVARLAKMAYTAGCRGLVASAQEVRDLRRKFGAELRIVCPGIRPEHSARNDQNRVATPSQALKAGADWLVIGRPITAAVHPRQAVRQIIQEMEAVEYVEA